MDNFEAAFNRWMDEYTNDPESFEKIETAAIEYLRERLDGKEPSYGQEAASIFRQYLAA